MFAAEARTQRTLLKRVVDGGRFPEDRSGRDAKTAKEVFEKEELCSSISHRLHVELTFRLGDDFVNSANRDTQMTWHKEAQKILQESKVQSSYGSTRNLLRKCVIKMGFMQPYLSRDWTRRSRAQLAEPTYGTSDSFFGNFHRAK